MTNDQLERVKEETSTDRSLYMGRVPEKTKKAFIELAEDEFCGDYGMTLKWLIDREMIRAELYDYVNEKIGEVWSHLEMIKAGFTDESEKEKTPEEKEPETVG